MAESVLAESVREAEKVAASVCNIKKMKEKVSDAVDDGMEAVRGAVKRGRGVAEGLVDDAAGSVRRYPLQMVAITFGAGIGAGLLLGWLMGRSRK